jgi:hypothetical protein
VCVYMCVYMYVVRRRVVFRVMSSELKKLIATQTIVERKCLTQKQDPATNSSKENVHLTNSGALNTSKIY